MKIYLMKNLKDKKYYEDIYDRVTVDHCRRRVKTFQDTYDHLSENKESKNISQETINKDFPRIVNVMMYYEQAYRFRDREKTIQEMMNRDKLKDDRIEKAEAPLVNCLQCPSELIPEHVDIGSNDKILFICDCPKGCIPRRAFYDDGEEYIVKDKKCPECDSDIETETNKNGDELIIIDKCSNCDYKEKFDYSSKEEVVDPNFERDKKEFCFDEEEGERSIEGIAQMDRMGVLGKEMKEENKKKEIYDAVKNLPQLSIHELKKRLDDLLLKNGYSDLIFAQPEMLKDIRVSFTAYESKSDRKDYDSRQNLKNLLKKDLLDTNWRLMSEGVEYRMGVVSGRLRGYDRKEDLLNLEEQKMKNAKK